ncbi:MAG: copper resistance protein CopB [Shewanella sp.]|nr:MAG: copper resistance protein CopB [Shewanella sp.]
MESQMNTNPINRYPFIAIALVALVSLASVDMAYGAETDDPLLTKVMIDEFENDLSSNSTTSWGAQAWIGYDLNKFWIKTEGEYSSGDVIDAEIQALYSRAIAPYWDLQMGLRRDLKPSPSRDWAVLGIQGLAPYFFEIDAALYVGKEGRTAVSFSSEYELLITQKLILTPEIEMNFYGQNDPDVGIGSGLSDFGAGLRLRYEIVREFAPYIGVNWSKKFGNTADYARDEGEEDSETQFVVGFRSWF